MKYSDWFFSLSNVQENNEGMVRCFKRFWVKDEKVAQEREMQRWINAAANRRAMWENLIPDLKEAYSLTESIEKDKVFFRETIFRGTYISRYLLRAGNTSTVEKAKEAPPLMPEWKKNFLNMPARNISTTWSHTISGSTKARCRTVSGMTTKPWLNIFGTRA